MFPVRRLHQQILNGILQSAENDEAAGTLLQSHDDDEDVDGRGTARGTNYAIVLS